MVRIVLVDDEERIRQGLAKLIAQAGEDCEVAAIYASAFELLADLERLDADLVITDVKMPGMSGLELLAQMQRLRPHWKLAVLSGFDEFAFVREALRIGVEDYLLKPVDTVELAKLLRKVRESLTQEQASASDSRRNHARLLLFSAPEAVPEPLRAAALRELEQARLFAAHYAVFAVIGHPAVPLRQIEAGLASWRREWLLLPRDERFAAAIVSIGEGDHTGTSGELGQTIMRWFPADCCGRVGASALFSGPGKLREACGQAEAAAQHAWYEPTLSGFADYAQLPARPGRAASAPQYALMSRAFREALASYDYERMREALRQSLAALMARRPGWDELKRECEAALAVIRNELALPPAASDAEAADPARHPNGAAYVKSFMAAVDEAIRHMQAVRRETWAVEKIKAHIQQHYKEELALGRLAELVYLTPSYLSKLFRTETGKTITDYLIAARMERAKALLRDSREWKTYEVGEQVGYADPAYFNKVFKKVVGCTPKEYRERVRHSLSK